MFKYVVMGMMIVALPALALPMFGGDGLTNAQIAKAQQDAQQKQAKMAHDAQSKCQQEALAATTAAQKSVARESCMESAAKQQATTQKWVAREMPQRP